MRPFPPLNEHRPWARQYAVPATPVGYYVTLLALGEGWTIDNAHRPDAALLPDGPLVPLLSAAQATTAHPYGNEAMGYVLDDMTNVKANLAIHGFGGDAEMRYRSAHQ